MSSYNCCGLVSKYHGFDAEERTALPEVHSFVISNRKIASYSCTEHGSGVLHAETPLRLGNYGPFRNDSELPGGAKNTIPLLV